MTELSVVESSGPGHNVLSIKDRIVIALVSFFTMVAVTLELYWIIFNQVMEQRTDLFAMVLRLYWPVDHSWRISGYPPEKALMLSLEGTNVFLTPLLSVILVWAIFKRRPYRYALQLLIGAYTTYGTLLYYLAGHISDYAVFENRLPSTFFMFYAANLPWLFGYAWLAWDAFSALSQAQPSGFRRTPDESSREA